MRKVLIAAAAATALTGMATPVAAQSPADRSDMRCLLVLQLAARDPKAGEQASKALYFYMGRLTTRGATTRLDPVFESEARGIKGPDGIKAELDRCAKELNQSAGQFQAMNQRMAAKAKAAAPPAKKP